MVEPSLILRETDAWTWSLFANQCYLGRVQLTLRRTCEGTLADLTAAEMAELHRSLQAYEGLMRVLFQPDRFNYKQLGNMWHQVHVHAVPRYATVRHWNDVAFVDARFGDDPYPEGDSPLDPSLTADFVAWFRPRIAALDLG